MKRSLFVLLLCFVFYPLLFAQSSMSNLYKQWMIEDINSGKFEKAAKEIDSVEQWFFDEYNEQAYVDINKALAFAEYAYSVGVTKSTIDKLSLYVADESFLFFYYCYNTGDYDAAVYYCELGARLTKNVLGENHPDYAVFLNGFGNLYCDIGDYSKAEKYYLKSLKIVIDYLMNIK